MSRARLPGFRASRDTRRFALAIAFVAIAAGGFLIAAVPDGRLHVWRAPWAGEPTRSGGPALERTRQEIEQRFQQGVFMLHARQHQHALTAFHRVLELEPAMPEAHVNMGFALIGLERHAAARDFFESALAIRKEQINAYYGLAVALEGLKDLPGAIGAMRTFVHLAKPDDPFLSKAQAALWEWESARDGERAGRREPRRDGAGK